MQDGNLLSMKACSKCPSVKDFCEFYRRSNSKDGYAPHCKDCEKDHNKSEKRKSTQSAYDESRSGTEKRRISRNNRQRARLQQDPLYKLSKSLRSRMHNVIKNMSKSASTVKMLGAPVVDIKKHLETSFKPGMSWENHGKWHIDHKIPLASAKTSDQLLSLFHYTNLQPLWASDNIKKSDNYEGNQ